MLEHCVTSSLVVYGAKCRCVWHHWVMGVGGAGGSLIHHQCLHGPWQVLWDPQRLEGLFGSSSVLSSSAPSYQEKQQLWWEPVAHIHLVIGINCKYLCSSRDCLQIYTCCWDPGQAVRAGTNSRTTGSSFGPGCHHLPLCLVGLAICTGQWRMMQGIRPATCKCTARMVSVDHAHSSMCHSQGFDWHLALTHLQSLGVVAYTVPWIWPGCMKRRLERDLGNRH